MGICSVGRQQREPTSCRCCKDARKEADFPTARLAHAQAPLLAHTLLHHPQAWPRQDTALGLLVSLRKFYQTNWVRHRMLSPVRLSP